MLNQGTSGNGSIEEFDRFGNFLGAIATNLTKPTAFKLQGSSDFFVVEQDGAIQQFSPGSSNTLATITTPGVHLQGIALFDDGTIAVSDAGNHVIWQVSPVTNVVSLLTGSVGVPGGTLGETNFARLKSRNNWPTQRVTCWWRLIAATIARSSSIAPVPSPGFSTPQTRWCGMGGPATRTRAVTRSLRRWLSPLGWCSTTRRCVRL